MRRIETVVLVALAVAGLVTLASSVPTHAQDRPCAADVQRFCQHVEPGNRQAIAQCLRTHTTELSEACRNRIQRAQAGATEVREACADDVRALCPGVELGGGRLRQCLQQHQAQLSSDCKAAIVQMRSRKQ